ncbi:MAG: flavodoxin-dependent (E)-4-hydroxy-3-methylbut-2-enyl-diphosphate synthase [Candidatus Omnitrophica bacterium]|jgi:(E)-4-hydroxy-3-methylbut-2-enyl-diphosphate synthase|nr:flavodoxin-dependent (E)-4-hydroxy-3-methylbut-2-enyl-diphosphate synthase [Candidatus Omnitrophota bacterium]
MRIKRRKTRIIKVGNVFLGGNYPVAVQSMAKYKTSDCEAVIRQINKLSSCGCEIVRLAIKDTDDALAVKRIKSSVRIPLVADIHFNYKFAIAAIENGIDKIRLNPGNIYKTKEVNAVVDSAKAHHIPIRVGLNSGSLRSDYKGIALGMVKSALGYIKVLEKRNFHDIVVSLKASNILDTVEAYRKMSSVCDYPLHLGLTATGLPKQGMVSSSIAIGALLLDGIGDTIRISLTDKPEEEARAARWILQALGLRNFGFEVISCPTCGRCEVDLVNIVRDFENQLSAISCQLSAKPIKVALMGCVVNGPGEAKHADIGVAFGKKDGLLFKKGKPVSKVSTDSCVETLIKQLRSFSCRGK